jgi:hypothetical protein
MKNQAKKISKSEEQYLLEVLSKVLEFGFTKKDIKYILNRI